MQPVRFVAGIYTFGAVSGEEIAIEDKAGLALNDWHAVVARATGIYRRLEDHNAARPDNLSDRLGRSPKQRDVRTLCLVDGRGHSDDEDLGGVQFVKRSRVSEIARGDQFLGLYLSRPVDPRSEFCARSCCTSKPMTVRIFPNATASGSPTYPRPITAIVFLHKFIINLTLRNAPSGMSEEIRERLIRQSAMAQIADVFVIESHHNKCEHGGHRYNPKQKCCQSQVSPNRYAHLVQKEFQSISKA